MIARSAIGLLVLAAGLTRADAIDPEPPGGAMEMLRGEWKARILRVMGKEMESSATYSFSKGKAAYSPGKGKAAPREMAVVPDKKRKDLIEMKPIAGGRAVRYFFKIEKGELHLVPVRIADADPKPDFTGATAPVLILARVKK